jgi:hypothetical protein
MPRIGEVEGLSIHVQDERLAKHKRPHFHVRGPDCNVSIALDDLAILGGKLPRNKRRAVLAYCQRYLEAIRDRYFSYQRGEQITPIVAADEE